MHEVYSMQLDSTSLFFGSYQISSLYVGIFAFAISTSTICMYIYCWYLLCLLRVFVYLLFVPIYLSIYLLLSAFKSVEATGCKLHLPNRIGGETAGSSYPADMRA